MFNLGHAEQFDRAQAYEDALQELATDMLSTGVAFFGGKAYTLDSVDDKTLKGCMEFIKGKIKLGEKG